MASGASTSSPPASGASSLHPAVFVLSWMFFSNVTIIFNKYLLDTAGFRTFTSLCVVQVAPILGFLALHVMGNLTADEFEEQQIIATITLTAIHLATATLFTQLLARYTALIPRPDVPITGRLYLRTILPIGLLYTISLVCSNLVYLTLSVAFIQMLKAIAPVTTLLISWAAALSHPRLSTLFNILVIAAGVFLSSVGEVSFAWSGFLIHMFGTVAESSRLLLIQTLLKGGGSGSDSEDGKLDEEEAARRRGIAGMGPLVGLYYFAPVCALLNGFVALLVEMPRFDPADLYRVGVSTLALNSVVAFMLNVAGVFLIGRTSALVMNLTGILKSIILVAASAAIWVTPVTLTQLIGYGIALVGMFYYSLPPEGLGPQVKAFKAWLSEVLASSDPAVGSWSSMYPPHQGLVQSARSCFAMTRYETVSTQDDEEGQRRAAAATTRQGEHKDAVA